MRATTVRLMGHRSLELVERDLEPGPGEVLVRTHQTSICDADLRAWRGMHMPGDLPGFEWIGHEGGGEVVEVGAGVRALRAGDRVMCFGPNNSWGTYFKGTEDNLLKAPEGLSASDACLGEPLAVGMFGIMESGVELGDTVAVVGLNFQGLLAVQAFKRKGARRVIAVDYSPSHLETAKKRGADAVVDTRKGGAIEAIRELTAGRGVDVAFHSCGYWNPHAEEYFNICCHIVRDEGTLVSIPDLMSDIKASLHRLHHHGVNMKFAAIMHHNPHFLKIWVPRALRAIAQGDVNLEGLITSTFSLDKCAEAVRLFDEDVDQVKVALLPA